MRVTSVPVTSHRPKLLHVNTAPIGSFLMIFDDRIVTDTHFTKFNSSIFIVLQELPLAATKGTAEKLMFCGEVAGNPVLLKRYRDGDDYNYLATILRRASFSSFTCEHNIGYTRHCTLAKVIHACIWCCLGPLLV